MGFAVEGGGDALLGERAQILGGTQMSVQEDVAGVDGFFEVSFVLKLIDVQIHDFTPECIESFMSRHHANKLKGCWTCGASIKRKLPGLRANAVPSDKKNPGSGSGRDG
jgi:hypothetical protein